LFDIIVIGGGPVGSEVAYKSVLNGYSVAVIEKRMDYSSPVCCTGIISLECINSFAIDKSLIERRFSRASFLSPSGNNLHFERETPLAGILDRAAFDAFMAGRAERAGASYYFDSTATSIEFASDRVNIKVARRNEFSVFDARVAVIATGAASPFLLEFPEYSASDMVVGAQARVEAPELEEMEIHCGREITPGFFAWIVPIKGGRALAGLLSRQSTGKYINKYLEKLKSDGKIKSNEVDISYRAIALRPPENTYGDRLIVVGGAAGQVKPMTGGGIYFGLLAAHTAAAIMDKAFRSGDLSSDSFKIYETGWKKRLESELNSGHYARSLYERMNDSEMNALFHLGKIMGIEKYLSAMEELSFDWHARAIAGSSDLLDRFSL
jgi:digeranylgeranylglycerophospholipid reductase